MSEKIFKYIPDKEINLLETENDLLGTSIYVDILKNIITTVEAPYTIGLFGGWGTGKSSIIKTLKENLRECQT